MAMRTETFQLDRPCPSVGIAHRWPDCPNCHGVGTVSATPEECLAWLGNRWVECTSGLEHDYGSCAEGCSDGWVRLYPSLVRECTGWVHRETQAEAVFCDKCLTNEIAPPRVWESLVPAMEAAGFICDLGIESNHSGEGPGPRYASFWHETLKAYGDDPDPWRAACRATVAMEAGG